MSDKLNNPPAFPFRATETTDNGVRLYENAGMALRDWFAGKALQGMLSNHKVLQYHDNGSDEILNADDDKGYLANLAFSYADAMLEEREASDDR